MRFSTSGILSTAADLSGVVYESFRLRISVRDHGDPPRTSHVDIVVVVDASIPYTDRHRGSEHLSDDADQFSDRADQFLDANLPLVLALLGFCAAFVVMLIVLIAVAAATCGTRRRATRSSRQV